MLILSTSSRVCASRRKGQTCPASCFPGPLGSRSIGPLMSPHAAGFQEQISPERVIRGHLLLVVGWLPRLSSPLCPSPGCYGNGVTWPWTSSLLKRPWARRGLLTGSEWGYCSVAGGQTKRETPQRDKQSITLLLIIISGPDVQMMNTWFNYHWRVFFLSALSQRRGVKSAGEIRKWILEVLFSLPSSRGSEPKWSSSRGSRYILHDGPMNTNH